MDKKAGRSYYRTLITNMLKYAIPLAVSIGLCYLLFTGIDFKEMAEIVRRDCDYQWIAAMLGLSLFSYVFRALRWQLQLHALGIKTPLFYVVLSMFGTYSVNLVLPRLGEIWRSGYIAQRQNAPFTAVFGSMVAERLADTITVALITLGAFIGASSTIVKYLSANMESIDTLWSLLTSPWLWGVAVLCIAGVWWFLAHKSSNKIVLRIRKAFVELWQGFVVIVRMPGKGKWLLWTVCIWGCYFTQFAISLNAFPSTACVLNNYGLGAVLVAFALSSLSMGVPSNGGIGPWQWAVIFGLGIYGVSQANAAAFANVALGSQTLMQIFLGIFTFTMIALDKRRKKSNIKTKHKHV